MTTFSRREAVHGAVAFAFTVAGAQLLLTPREARAKNADFLVLTAPQVQALDAFADTLLPGAREAGVPHFIDQQLAAPPAACKLVLRYFDVPPPYARFYQAGLAGLDAVSHRAHGRAFAALDVESRNALTSELSQGSPAGWSGPPPPLFFMAVRSDAVDVVYGTPEGFASLGVSYMPHIMPARNW